jgi:putative Mn2+ efflux pump MntP
VSRPKALLLSINLDQKGVKKMGNPQKTINLVLKAVAVGMSVASIVMGFIPDVADVDTHITLLSIGLAALAVAALQKEE